MRLQILHDEFSPIQKAQMWLMSKLVGHVPGPIATMSYRRQLFGKPMSDVFDEAMRRMTEWSIGDVELFAAFVSKLNQCVY